MGEVIMFLYNIALLITYSAALSALLLLSMQRKGKLEMYISILFAVFILDNTIIYMTEFLENFSKQYDLAFMTIPAFKTVIFLAGAVCSLYIFNTIFERKFNIIDFSILVVFGLLLLFIPMLPDSAFMVWLWYLPNQIYMIYLGSLGLRIIKKEPEKYTEHFYVRWKQILISCVIFHILILIEDTIVIFNFDVYSDIMVKINNRSVSEDIMSLVYAVAAFLYAKQSIFSNNRNAEIIREEIEKIEKEVGTVVPIDISAEILRNFAEKYQLTSREQEILRVLLEDKTNQEISNELFISLGTVKSHVHNIFQKVEVSKRKQLLKKYDEFKEEYLELLAVKER